MDPKMRTVLAFVAGIVIGMALLGTAVALPAAIHAVVTRTGVSGEYDCGMAGQRPGAADGCGMMGPRGGGYGQQDGTGVCPDDGTCPNSDVCPDATDGSATES